MPVFDQNILVFCKACFTQTFPECRNKGNRKPRRSTMIRQARLLAPLIYLVCVIYFCQEPTLIFVGVCWHLHGWGWSADESQCKSLVSLLREIGTGGLVLPSSRGTLRICNCA
jgi:hypothetical protein